MRLINAYVSSRSFLGRMSMYGQAQLGAPLQSNVVSANEYAIADTIKLKVLENAGYAWLPRSLVSNELSNGQLLNMGPTLPMQIRLYRSANRSRQVLNDVWVAAQKVSDRIMLNRNTPC